MSIFTLVHVLLSLAGIGSGFIVMYGLLTWQPVPGWTAVYLGTTLATSLTGFGFPVTQFLPSHGVGIVSIVVLALAIAARYGFRRAVGGGLVYVVGAVLALYLNVFVLVVQAFRRVPFLNGLAPTQTEPPFSFVQGLLFTAFLVLGVLAVRRSRSGSNAAPAAASAARP
jgi:hypothetical protein